MSYISEIKGRSGKDHIDSVLKRSGPLEDVSIPAPETVAAWTGVLPDLLIDFWNNHGLGTLQGGLLRICLPDEFDGLLSQIFQADADFSHKDCHVIGYGVFGSLVVWSERHWVVEVDLNTGTVSASGLIDETKKRNPNASIISYLLGRSAESLDVANEKGTRLFASAAKTLGRPEKGQAFGFAPALALGGAPSLKNLKIVPALEHFALLAQLQQFQLYDFLATPPGPVRPIG